MEDQPLPPYQGPRRNFFSLLAPIIASPTRELEPFTEETARFFQKFNPPNVPSFIPSFLTCKFIHLLNEIPGYQNQGRITLSPENKDQYSKTKILAFLRILFNRDDADCTVLLLQGHGNKEGELVLLVKEGEIGLNLKNIKEIWDQRTTKSRNKELFLIVDCSFSGRWVANNMSPDIFIQTSCSDKETAKDFIIGDDFVGSVFLHNLMILNNYADCFYEVPMTPTATRLSIDQEKRIEEFLMIRVLKNGWDEFKKFMPIEVRAFAKGKVLSSPNWEDEQVEVMEEKIKYYKK